MPDIISCSFLFNVLLSFTGVAAATVSSPIVSFPRNFTAFIRTYPQTYRPPGSAILASNINHVRNHPRDFIQTSKELQSGTTAPFPTYAIGLLALSIVLCAFSSALVITIICSNTARVWIGNVASRVYTSATAITTRLARRWTVDTDIAPMEEHEKDEVVLVLNISPASSIPSFHTDVARKVKSDPTTAPSNPAPTTTPMPCSAVKIPNRNYEHTAASSELPVITSPLCNPSPSSTSPSLDHLQSLVVASTGLLMSLTADMQSRCISRLTPRSNREVVRNNPRTTDSNLFLSAPSTSSIISSGFTSIEVVVNPAPSRQISSVEGENASSSAADIPIQRSPVFTIKHSVAHSSPSHSSSSTFYSLSDDTHLSPSVAFQSLGDLTTLGDSCGIDLSLTRLSQEAPNVDDLGNSLRSPRYVHGVQLETIHEEDGEEIAPIPFTTPATQPNAELPTCPPPPQIRRSSSLSPVPLERLPEAASDVFSTVSTPWRAGRVFKVSEDIASDQYSGASPDRNEHLPSTLNGFFGGPRSPGLPRFVPAARAAPLPSDPKSGIAPVSALRSPEGSTRCHSVAWLSPVIDWAVDYPGEDQAYGVAPESPRRQELPVNAEGDEECDEALHAADAMAAVMDSLASIGLDPTAMGLTTEDPISHTLSVAGVLEISPPTSFVESMTIPQSRHAQAVAENLVEEEEVENEVGIEPWGSACNISSLNPLRSRFPENRCLVKGQLNDTHTTISEEQLRGEEAKTAQSYPPTSSQTDFSGTEVKVVEQINMPGASSGTARKKVAVQLAQRDSGRIHYKQTQTSSTGLEDLGGSMTSRAIGRARSPSIGQPLRTPRGAPDRLYPSPSSLAGLSHVEVAKKFSSQSPSSAISTPSPRGKYPSSPPTRSSPASPRPLRKAKGTSLSPILSSTPSTLTSSPRNEPVSPSPRSRSPVFLPQQPEHMSTPVPSSLASSNSTPMIFPRKKSRDILSVSHSQWHKSIANVQLGGPHPILQESTNSV